MTNVGGAYTTTAADTDFRKTWDKEKYAEKARMKDQEERERMQENVERLKNGKKPRKSRRNDTAEKPTELMKQRDSPLELEKNLNKTMVVQNPGGRGPGQPGFFCATCNRTYKDTLGYLDHINSRAHLRALGQSTRLERSTLAQVQARIAFLREKTKEASSAKEYDFDRRIAEVKAKEMAQKAERKAAIKAKKEASRLDLLKNSATDSNDDLSRLMGFQRFGSSKK